MANQTDDEIVVRNDMRIDAITSYSEIVDSLIRSETASFYGNSPLYSYAWLVDSVIRSSSASYEADYETHNSTATNFPSHSQPHTLEDTYSHSHPQLFGAHQSKDLGTSPVHVHGFASAEDGKIIFSLDQLKAATDNFSIHPSLVYEFMAKGSLHSHLQVALDTAKALSFLHEVHLIYRDFKSSNILLDTNYNAKLSNFGFVINGAEEDEISTSIAGTVGYFDPAYFRTGLPSKKSDVYGFGVVLLELISGKRVYGTYGPNENYIYLVEWAKPLLIDRKGIFEVMDSRMFYQYSDREAERIAHLAIQCLSDEQEVRPTMDEVVRVLEHL